jgi:hypothetical protein
LKSQNVSKERLNAGREFGSRLIRDPDFATSLPVQIDTGEAAVMTVSSRERMKSFFARVDEIGLPLTVAMRHKGALMTISVRPIEVVENREDQPVLSVHPNITMGMMADVLWQSAGSLIVHLGEPEDAWNADYEVVGV